MWFPPRCPVQVLSFARCCASFILCSEQIKMMMILCFYFLNILIVLLILGFDIAYEFNATFQLNLI